MRVQSWHRRREQGVALIIVLALVFLLSALIVAFLARVITERSVSDSSMNVTKADLIARSALDNVCSDLKQEIVAGSTATTVGTSPNTSIIYTPNAPADAIPMRSGNPSPSPSPSPAADPIPNLIRRSIQSDPIPAPGVPSRASAVNSTQISANGRSVSLARWNAHFLIPRIPGATDTTPVNSFTAPDWVMVTQEEGPVILKTPTTDINGKNVTAVGRYAYAIYDEGGLLDANVAGYPSNTIQNASGRKGVAAYADLTQLPTGPSNSPTSAYVIQTEIDQLIGLRNYASARPNGTYSAFSFDAAAALRYFSFVTKVTPAGSPDPTTGTPGVGNGFMNVSNAILNGRTDQAFLNRQQLIQQVSSIATAQGDANLVNVLQYLGTFSRDLEQPSFAPNPNRPRVQTAAGVLAGADGPVPNLAANANKTPFGTGNDAYNASSSYADLINPSFLTVRAASSFTRNDGSTAVIGEPLVKQRFPLSRLSLVAYNSPANARSQSDAIYKNFGLVRNASTGVWYYDHRSTNDGSVAGILKLSDVAAWVDPTSGKVGRDPDFFELLKAAINVGSLAKGAAGTYNGSAGSPALDWNQVNSAFDLQQELDNSVDLNLLQIGANIIDQFDSDSFPTQLAFANDTHIVSGVEDLPYIYRVRDRPVQATSGTGEYLLLPELWNPHALNRNLSANPTVPPPPPPSNFQFGVVAFNPAASNGLQVTYRGVNSPLTPLNLTATWTGSTNLSFTAGEPSYFGFREPTLLAELGKPAGTNLQGHTTPEYAPPGFPQPPGRTLVGISPIYTSGGTTPTSFAWTPDGVTAHCAVKIDYGNVPVVYCYLEYQDPTYGLIKYDQQVFQWGQSTQFNIYTPLNVWDINSTANADIMAATRTDPRTSRWGMPHTLFANDIQPTTAGTSSYVYPSIRWTGGLAYGHHIGGIADAGFVGSGMGYSASVYPDRDFRGFDSGYWEENSIRSAPAGGSDPYGNPIASNPGNSAHYDRDPDGIVRRVIGGYASDPANGGAAGATVGLPMVTSNNQSRPIILNRPFRSVAELGYVCRGTPWANLNFSFPESGDAALLDVFCVDELESANSLVAGRVDINTRQAPVLQALIAGALTDDSNTQATLPGVPAGTQAAAVAAALVSRTTNTTTAATGPLANRAELVGRWYQPLTGVTTPTNPDPTTYYTGFSADLGGVAGLSGQPNGLSPRLRDASIRALADSANARTWSLLIDLVAQTGRYPATATAATQLPNFMVAGERHYWLHVAIDRYTGQILDQQLETLAQ
jgi:hypothetical protein